MIVELRNYRKDGIEFWNRITIAPVMNESGEMVNYDGFQEDITERKEQQLERERIIERMTDAIVTVNQDWQFPMVAPRAEEIYEMS